MYAVVKKHDCGKHQHNAHGTATVYDSEIRKLDVHTPIASSPASGRMPTERRKQDKPEPQVSSKVLAAIRTTSSVAHCYAKGNRSSEKERNHRYRKAELIEVENVRVDQEGSTTAQTATACPNGTERNSVHRYPCLRRVGAKHVAERGEIQAVVVNLPIEDIVS